MTDTVVVRIQKPVPSRLLDEKMREIFDSAGEQDEDGERINLAEKARAAADELTQEITVTMKTASRRDAVRRGTFRTKARTWLLEHQGKSRFQDIIFDELDQDTILVWAAMWQAADIVGSMVDADIDGWEPPEPDDIEAWADVPDYIFDALLTEAWALNPHWRNEALAGSGNV